ncbi:hypothetical protein [Sphingobacterium sp. LRF_L2]|uniref:hypothetical protein n=1 Tax=Sphingobacterium sp. LRF_L2 TaxID=3369421 RepID=UPI003F5F6F1E
MIQRTLSSSMDDRNVTMYPIIFPKELVHSDIAEKMIQLISEAWPDCEVSVISAGEINVGFFFVGGFSETLGLESDDLDDHVISSIDYFNYHRYRSPKKRVIQKIDKSDRTNFDN